MQKKLTNYKQFITITDRVCIEFSLITICLSHSYQLFKFLFLSSGYF
jgi:hypothetical protein